MGSTGLHGYWSSTSVHGYRSSTVIQRLVQGYRGTGVLQEYRSRTGVQL
jgi:hypothetical protein